MDAFLTDLYEKEVEKVASTDYQKFLHSLSTSDLEELIGLNKVAVDGKATPSLPDGGPMHESGKCPACMPKKTTPPELPEGKKTAGALEKNFLPVGSVAVGEHTTRTPAGDDDARKVLKNLTEFDVKQALEQAKVAGIGSAIIPRISQAVTKHPGMVIPTMGGAAGAVAGAASAPPGSRVSGALGGAVLGAGVGAGGQHLLRKSMATRLPAPKLAAAQMLTLAMRATKGAPEAIKQAAVKMAADKLALSRGGFGGGNESGGGGGLGAAVPLTGAALGALAAPPGEAPRGAVRGAMTAGGFGLGLEGGGEIGRAITRRFPHNTLAALAGLAALPAGTVLGGMTGGALGKALLPYRVGPEAQQPQAAGEMSPE